MTRLRSLSLPALLLVFSAVASAQSHEMGTTGEKEIPKKQTQDKARKDAEPQEKPGQEKGWLGVRLEPAGEKETGLKVTEVIPKSPAERAGVRADDVIKQIDGKPAADLDSFVGAV